MEEAKRNPLNVEGRYYVTEECLACEVCQVAAPDNFRYGDDIMSHVFKQPTNAEEAEQCNQALLECPMAAIRDDGDS
jgi:ferredoxin